MSVNMDLEDIYDFERIYNLVFNQTEDWAWREKIKDNKSLEEDVNTIKNKIINKVKKTNSSFATMDLEMKKNALYIFIVQLCRDLYED